MIDLISIVQQLLQSTPTIYFWYVAIGVVIILLNDLTFIPLALLHDRLLRRYRRHEVLPLVTVLVPAHNEQEDIESLLHTLFEQTYRNMEIVVINDGSTDNTREILEPYAFQGRIRLLNLGPPNAGKHAALNAGIKIAKGEILLVVDADGLLERDAVANMVVAFRDPNVMSVSGNIRVANPVNLLTRCQSLEYVRDINIPRRAFDLLNIALVVPGPLGAFRRSVILDIGQYDPDTVTEDFDLTVKVQKARNGKQIASRNITNAVAYTEAPERLRDLIHQRKRWYGGMAQTYAKHQRYRMWSGSGSYSMIGVPYLFYTLFIVPLLELIMTGMTIVGFVLDPLGMIVVFIVFSVMETFTSILAVTLDRADWRLVLLSPLYVIGYRQLLDLIRVYSYIQAMRGRLGWERAQRFGETSIKARSVLSVPARAHPAEEPYPPLRLTAIPTQKNVLSLLSDGPTLEQLTERISRELSAQVLSQSVGKILVNLQKSDCIFLEDGRWWRTPKGILFLEKLLGEEASEHETLTARARLNLLSTRLMRLGPIQGDLIVASALALAVMILKLSFSHAYLLPSSESTEYLLGAQSLLSGYDPHSFELLFPPFLSGLIALLWAVFGESYSLAVLIQPICTVLAGLILYIVLRDMFDWKTALLSILIFLFTPAVFTWTNLMLPLGLQFLFSLLCIFFAWKSHSTSATPSWPKDLAHAVLIGFFAALASLVSYDAIIFLPAVLVLVWRRNFSWNLEWIMVCGLSFVATWLPWLRWNMVHANGGSFPGIASQLNHVVGPQLGYTHFTDLIELVSILGIVFLLAGILSRKTFRERRIAAFICWFVVGIAAAFSLFYGDFRYSFGSFPAIVALIAMGTGRLEGFLSFRPKVAFNLLLGSWLVFLLWSSNVAAIADLNTANNATAKEFPTVVSWVNANMQKNEIAASDAYAPQFNYFTKRIFYSLDNLERESREKGTIIRELLPTLNVTYLVVTSLYAQAKDLNNADYLFMLKRFEEFIAYAVMNGAGSKHLGVLLVGNYSQSPTIPPELLLSRLAIQDTIRGMVPHFETISSGSFFTRLKDTFAEDGLPRYGLVVLLDEAWNNASQKLSLNPQQLSVLKRLVEEQGVALLTSYGSTQGWLSETSAINSNETSTFTAFHIASSKHIRDWSNLLGSDRTWNASSPSRFMTFSHSPPNLESIVETSSEPNGKGLVWVGYQGKGRTAHFCCPVSRLSFSPQMYTVNPILIRLLFWLLGDYPRIVKGTGFKIALRIDDAQTSMHTSIEKHASTLLYDRGVPLVLGVIPVNMTEATSVLLLHLRERGCELVLHGFPEHLNLVDEENQTETLLEGKEMFMDSLGFYPDILAPPFNSYNDDTVQAAQTLGFKAISGNAIDVKPPGEHRNHFGYPYGNSTVLMLPVLPALDNGIYAGWFPSKEVAIARTKWLLASRKWLLSSCIVVFHFNDTRLPDIASLVDWAKGIGAQFTTLQEMMTDTYMSPSLEQYPLYVDASSFSDLDMLENGSKITFVLNQSAKVRIDIGRKAMYCKVDDKIQKITGPIIVTETLEAGTRHTILIQASSQRVTNHTIRTNVSQNAYCLMIVKTELALTRGIIQCGHGSDCVELK